MSDIGATRHGQLNPNNASHFQVVIGGFADFTTPTIEAISDFH